MNIILQLSMTFLKSLSNPQQKSILWTWKRWTTVLLGEDKGANPVESTLATLNGCLTTSLIYHAAAQGVKIVEVETTLSGDLDLHGFLGMDENVRNGYEKIQVNFSIKSDASEDKLKELGGLAQKISCIWYCFSSNSSRS